MAKSIKNLNMDFFKIVTHRITPSIIKDITVECYGDKYHLNQVCTILAEGGNTLSLKPFDKKNISIINKALLESDFGVMPLIMKDAIKINFPKITEERRLLLIKKVKKIGELCKVSIRNIRRSINKKIKQLVKDEDFSLDDEKKYLSRIEEITNKYIENINDVIIKKERDLLCV